MSESCHFSNGNSKKWGHLKKKKRERKWKSSQHRHCIKLFRSLCFGNPLSEHWHRMPLFWSCDLLRGGLVYTFRQGFTHAHQRSFIQNAQPECKIYLKKNTRIKSAVNNNNKKASFRNKRVCARALPPVYMLVLFLTCAFKKRKKTETDGVKWTRI